MHSIVRPTSLMNNLCVLIRNVTGANLYFPIKTDSVHAPNIK